MRVQDIDLSYRTDQVLPEFIRENYPVFESFLKAFYEWLEYFGAVEYSDKIVRVTNNEIIWKESFQIKKSDKVFARVENGPAAGQIRRISSHKDNITTLEEVFEVHPIDGSKITIFEKFNPGAIREYADVQSTLHRFVDHFRKQYLVNIPKEILADPRKLVYHIRDFYRGRGTENSFRLLFRILYNEEIEIFYPRTKLFRTSASRWSVRKIIRITSTSDTFDMLHRRIEGAVSGTSAYVEDVRKVQFGLLTVSEIELSNIKGDFRFPDGFVELPEEVFATKPIEATEFKDADKEFLVDRLLRIVTEIQVVLPGSNYKIGDPVQVIGGGGYPATGVVSAIITEVYEGKAQNPPTTAILDPYFGANPINEYFPSEPVPFFPGTYFGEFAFSDVILNLGSQYSVTSSQIILKATEVATDDFFIGDIIELITGAGAGQLRTIVSYNGFTKIATVDIPWVTSPNSTTFYRITRSKGGMKKIQLIDPGVGFTSQPSVVINSPTGSLGTAIAILGAVATTPGQWLDSKGFLSSGQVLQDSDYWQNLSYEIQSSLTFDNYKEYVLKLLHPAGTKLFGKTVVDLKLDGSIGSSSEFTVDMGDSYFDNILEFSTSFFLELVQAAQLSGFSYQTIDDYKFLAFYQEGPYDYPNESLNNSTNTPLASIYDLLLTDFIDYPNTPPPFIFEVQVSTDISSLEFSGGFMGPSTGILGETLLDVDSLDDLNISLLSLENFESTSYVPEVDIEQLGNELEPTAGNLLRYDFIKDELNDQEINKSLDYYNTNNLIFGSPTPIWTAKGIGFNNAIGTSAIPIPTDTFEMVLVYKSTNLSDAAMTIFKTTTGNSDDGFSLEVLSGGKIAFRTIANSAIKRIISLDPVNVNVWSMISVIFDSGLMKLKVDNQIEVSDSIGSWFDPVGTTNITYGSASHQYPTTIDVSDSFGTFNFGVDAFDQDDLSYAGVIPSSFKGELAYFTLYDRVLANYERTGLKNLIKSYVAGRGIVLP